MSFVRRLARTRPGRWLRRRFGAPLVRLGQRLDRAVQRRRPGHRAHDRAAEAALSAFERRGAGGP
ncbi:hypothetical protein [Pseudoruegeria sp. HB172150]|uniref:hypothetical protein n=1 Tax=Pseudoruegeria sp. HB172150 TaxID=2721164 RepID=UPI001552EA51|nr:hypothetical protein [Pseudoruegeria sp. HB172150]